jgi:curved DNA-binding protein CbpA
MDYYAILGVDNDASILTIKRAYKTQALSCHPDKVSPTERKKAEEKFKLLTEAYQVLGDPARKSEYDSLKTRPQNLESSSSIFDDFLTRAFSDPFSHPFFSSVESDPFFSNSIFSSAGSDPFFSSAQSSYSMSSQSSRGGISKTISETRSGNNIIREEILFENGHVISRTKTVLKSPERGYKIHIS